MSPISGNGLAVFGSFLGAAPPEVAAVEDGAPAVDGADAAGFAAAADAGAAAGAAAPAPAPAAPLAASVALTSFWVMTRGGFDVMMVAVSLSFSRKSEICAGLPLRMILTPRLSISLWENIL